MWYKANSNSYKENISECRKITFSKSADLTRERAGSIHYKTIRTNQTGMIVKSQKTCQWIRVCNLKSRKYTHIVNQDILMMDDMQGNETA